MGTPSDWVSGERVFAPPTGTFDVDWLVPAVVEAVPGCTPAQARAALLRARQERGDSADDGAGPVDVELKQDDLLPGDLLRTAAARVVAEAQRTFRSS